MFVVGQEDADHGSSTVRTKRLGGSAKADTEPPRAETRSRRPVRPLPKRKSVNEAPSLDMVRMLPRNVIVQVLASLWRRTLVTPSRTAQPRAPAGSPVEEASPITRQSMPAEARRERAPDSSTERSAVR